MPNYERLAGWAPVRFLRNMTENDERTQEGPRAVQKPGDGVEVVGGGEGGDCGHLGSGGGRGGRAEGGFGASALQ